MPLIPFWKRNAICLVLVVVFGGGAAQAQFVAVPIQREFESQNAWTTRQSLNEVLRAYPPTLREILQRDASLLSNDTFMATYPLLREFLNGHPEVGRNPVYFFGQPETVRVVQTAGRDIVEPVLVMGAIIGIVGFFVWIIRAVVDHRRWLRLTKLQTEANGKLMERFTSNEDLLAFIQTPAGRHFMESSTVPAEPRSVGAPVLRILWSIQVGVVTWLAGAGMQFISTRVRVGDDASDLFYVLGVLGMAVGLGFVLSGIVTYALSRRFGLFDRSGSKENNSSTRDHA